MDPQPTAPPVVAVVVTSDSGSCLEETLSALAAQDYPSLSILVIDAAANEDPTPRIAAVAPDAYVRRLTDGAYARAANEVLTVVEGASHFLFCHDDVAPFPDAVRLLVEEAFRSNAGVVCPKVVEWEHPDRLLSVGASADVMGYPVDLVERGELDQEQHDAVRDVFVAPGGAVLVRADLFRALGGFDPAIDLLGEDVDLSWRAQLVGARVIVNPAARVRHREALTRGERPGWSGAEARLRAYRLAEAHRLRTLLTCYGTLRLIALLPQAALMSLAEAVWHLLAGRPAYAAATIRAWPDAVAAPGLRHFRKTTQAQRGVPDSELRRLQARGSSRVSSQLRQRLQRGLSPALAESVASRDWRLPAAAWAGVVVLLLVGSRSLLGRAIPGVGHLPVTAGGPARWWRAWASGWQPGGLGSAAPSAPALALLGLAGAVLFGATGILQQVLVLGPLALGVIGMYRAARAFPSSRARALALILYAAVPVPYGALARGRWAGLVAYGVAPWLLAGLCRAVAAPPGQGDGRPRLVRHAAALGALVAVAAALAPAVLLVVPVIAAGLIVGGLAAGRLAGAGRAAAAAAGATVGALVLLLPWSADLVRSRVALFGVPGDPAHPAGLGRLLAFHAGPVGVNWMNWGLAVAAAVPLLIGTSWRFEWAARCWGVAVVGWAVAWLGGRGWIGLPVPQPEVLLAAVAAALSLSAALGLVAFEVDLPGYRFGLRQMAATVAGVAAVLSVLPTVAAARGGRWRLPARDLGSTLTFVAPGRAGPPFRLLWLGDPDALPLGSWRLADGIGYATTDGRLPDVTDGWAPASAGATPRLAAALRLAAAGRTSRLGHLLAPMGVRYLVVPLRLGAAAPAVPGVARPAALLAGLAVQEDLRAVAADEALVMYENAAWAPQRAVLPPAAVGPSRSSTAAAAQQAPMAGAPPVLPGRLADHFRGRVPGPGEVYVASTASGRWRLSVRGRGARQRPAFGWAMAFSVPGNGGEATLAYRAPVIRDLLLVLEALLWLVALAWVVRRRRDRLPPSIVDSAPLTPPRRSLPRRSRHEPETAIVEPEELWSP